MSDKTFELMEKMYVDFSNRFGKIEEGQKKLELKIENEVSNKVKILFESQGAIIERLERIENKLDDISEKVEKHDIKIQVIEGGKKKKLL